jgi:nucleotidyltransferase substrate binding protein (TIGR01987 family)
MNEYAEAKILQFENMLKIFSDSLVLHPTITERTAAIKNFELTYELAWKAMKRLLEFREAETLPTTSSVIKKAFKYGLINDEKNWLEIIQLRNKAVHTYVEALAIEVYKKLNATLNSFNYCLQKMKSDLGI